MDARLRKERGKMNTLSSLLEFIGNRIGENRRVLLWTNPNPEADFPSQSISLNLSPFTQVEIDVGEVITLEKGRGGYHSVYVWTQEDGNCMLSRFFSAQSNSVSVGAANLMGIGTSTTQKTNLATYMKPYRIYGIY